MAAFLVPVLGINQGAPDKQMLWVHAFSVIATMTNHSAMRDCADVQTKTGAVGRFGSTLVREVTVTAASQ